MSAISDSIAGKLRKRGLEVAAYAVGVVLFHKDLQVPML